MALMSGLQLNVKQQLKLTPQLQQSIKILQYSALEVQQTIKTALESNYMLEVDEDDLEESIDLIVDSDQEMVISAKDPSETEMDLNDDSDIHDSQLDIEWEEVFGDYLPSSKVSASNEYTAPENYTSAHESLYDILNWQLEIAPFTDVEHLVASYIIDDINEEGFLNTPLPDMLNYINAEIQSDSHFDHISLEFLDQTLAKVQQFEPSGVAARDLKESIILQLSNLKQTPYVVTAKLLVNENFDWLIHQDHKRICSVYGLDDSDLHKVLKTIQSLNPRPGRAYSSDDSEVIVPDLRLKRVKGAFVVELNQNIFPKLSVNSAYVNLTKNMTDSDQSQKIKEQIFEAKSLIKSVQSRGETLLRVGKFIVGRQKDFFEKGEIAMQTLVLREVADSLDLHESTISRATNQKYMQTPRGTFELKYFFSTGVSQYGSDDQSSTSIKAHLKELIESEDPSKPLSDNKLMQLLEEREITVARRTIAKYREALHIPSSSKRKKLNKFKL